MTNSLRNQLIDAHKKNQLISVSLISTTYDNAFGGKNMLLYIYTHSNDVYPFLFRLQTVRSHESQYMFIFW